MDEERIIAVDIGETTMLADLMNCLIDEFKVLPKAWQAMSKSAQDESIERAEKQIRVAVEKAINIIATRDMPEVTGVVEKVVFKSGAQATIKFGGITQGVHDLADAEGHLVKIVIPQTDDLVNDSEKPTGEVDQSSLDLGHEYNDSEEAHTGEPFINNGHDEADEQLADALDGRS